MIEFRLPAVGEGIREAEVVRWLVQEGERVEEFEPMLEVQTDKALVELPAPATGYVKEIMAPSGSIAKVGDILLTLDDEDVPFGLRKLTPRTDNEKIDGTRAEDDSPERSSGNDSVSSKPGPSENAGEEFLNEESDKQEFCTDNQGTEEATRRSHPLATPAVRHFAREVGVDLNEVEGTGPNGRIEKSDIETYIERHQSLIFSQSAQKGFAEEGALLWDVVKQAKSTARRRPAEKPVHVGAEEDSVRRRVFSARTYDGAEKENRTPTRVPFRGIRRTTAERVVKSAFTAPHVTVFDECDVTALVKLRERWNQRLQNDGQRMSYLPFIIKALVYTLEEFPYFNAQLDEEAQEVVLIPDYHIGIAVDTQDGLFVPVVRHADKLSLREIGEEIFRLSAGVRNRSLGQEDLRGSTFSITNMGPLGSIFATPILNYPEVGILGTHPVQRKPVVVEEEIVIRDIMTLSLSFDHRVIDGAVSVRFLNHLKNYLQHPDELMLELR